LGDKQIMAVADIIEQVEKLTVLELNELVKTLEEKWGVSAAAPVAVAAAPGAGAAAAPEVEKTEFDAVLAEVGPEKIKVIKAVRELTSLGLTEAKAFVESAPKAIKTGVPKDEAEQIKAKLAEVGAKVEIK
jgi:large subunit ribosomal protein L7/L12